MAKYLAIKHFLVEWTTDQVLPSGIILSAKAMERPNAGVVIAAPEHDEIKVGDKVLFDRYAGTTVEYDVHRQIIAIPYEDILALVEE